jgi:glycosyltransferase involved in cell wall biosynthesis
MKILACAYACNPFTGSEEGVGWGWVNAIAQYHEVWVLLAGYHRQDVEEALRRDPKKFSHVHFCYVEEKLWHYRPTSGWIRIENSIAKPIMNWAYRLWLRDAYKLGARLNREIEFDLIHQITYVGFRFPGHLWKLNIPFVWGPIGGLENTPWQLLPIMGFRGMARFGGRNIINSLHRRFLQLPKRAFRKSRGGIIAATKSIQREIRHWYGEDSTVISEIGTPHTPATIGSCRSLGDPLILCWSGLHQARKALPLLLSALAVLPKRVSWRLDILGTGPCSATWRKRAERLGVAPRCRWLGRMSRDQALRFMGESHVFVISSLQDLTSTVLVEALALGVPVICPDHCGFSDAVDDSCGRKLAIGTAQEFVRGLAKAIEQMHGDEPLRRRLAAGAFIRARQFSWETKVREIDAVYRQVMISS